MSSHYEVVFACFLRGGTPDSTLDVLRWHLGLIADLPAGVDADEHPYPLLEPDPDSRLPGGETASLRQRSRGGSEAWGLFSRTFWLDDDLGTLVTVLDLLAPHVEDPGYGGHLREEFGAEPTVFTFGQGTYDLREPRSSA